MAHGEFALLVYSETVKFGYLNQNVYFQNRAFPHPNGYLLSPLPKYSYRITCSLNL